MRFAESVFCVDAARLGAALLHFLGIAVDDDYCVPVTDLGDCGSLMRCYSCVGFFCLNLQLCHYSPLLLDLIAMWLCYSVPQMGM